MAIPITNWLNKLQLEYSSTGNSITETVNFGIDFDHVYYNDKKYKIGAETRPWNLRDFFEKVSTFFKKPMFMIYSKSDASPALNIMEWYQASGKGLDPNMQNN